MTQECFERILNRTAGDLYLLFCNFSLKRAPKLVSASGFTKSGYTPVSDRGSFHSERMWKDMKGEWAGGQGWIKFESLDKFHR